MLFVMRPIRLIGTLAIVAWSTPAFAQIGFVEKAAKAASSALVGKSVELGGDAIRAAQVAAVLTNSSRAVLGTQRRAVRKQGIKNEDLNEICKELPGREVAAKKVRHEIMWRLRNKGARENNVNIYFALDDATQSAYDLAVKRCSDMLSADIPVAYFWKIVGNHYKGAVKRSAVQDAQLLDYDFKTRGGSMDIDAGAQRTATRLRAEEVLSRLRDSSQKNLMFWFYIEGRTDKEIAVLLGHRPDTVKKKRAKALVTLRDLALEHK